MSPGPTVEAQILRFGEKNSTESLKILMEKTNAKVLTNLLNSKLGRNDCITFWNYLLQGLSADTTNISAKDKRFVVVKNFLNNLMHIELSYKHQYDLITRLCQDLPTFTSEQLIEILEHCQEGMRMGDPKSVNWKDLLPETLNILASMSEINVNGIVMSGKTYRESVIRNLCTMRWVTEVLTPIADMFKELNLSSTENMTVLNKLAGSLQSLAPSELPALAYQLFSMCTTASHIIIPIMALEKYFHRHYYKKLYADMLSNTTDYDSIDEYSDQELREAEETILHHLNYCTQYKISELQLHAVLKNFISMPDLILTPFVFSAILSMTAANREPDSRLSSSAILPLLRTVIKNNEEERIMSDYSVWCRDSLQRKQVDLEQIFTVLIDQNKDGKDVITPGLVNLAFTLLKTKNCRTLNVTASNFFVRFIRKRFVFGKGIVKKLAEWMITEQDQYQYSDCLMLLSIADTFTISECITTIKYVLDFFLLIPGEQAMRMMGFILPILKISPLVRDAFIETLRKAMNSSEVRTRRVAVYGFCMILKQLNNSNSQRSQLGAAGMCTQQTISGFSLMTQASLGSTSNPQRHFNMLTLEIIGVLRNCFNESLEIKCTLYEYLQRAIEINPKLVPHVLQFIDWHFRSYFNAPQNDENDETELTIKFDKIVFTADEAETQIEISDNLGSLILFVSHCLVIFDKDEYEYDVRIMKRLINLALKKVTSRNMNFEEATGNFCFLKAELMAQQINFLEGLMSYVLLSSQPNNDYIKQLSPIFREHVKLQGTLKTFLNTTKKSLKNTKKLGESEKESSNVTINGLVVKKNTINLDNIWDLVVLERFLHLLHDDIVPFASPNNTTSLRSNVELVRYVLEITALKIEGIRLEPEYKQVSHSKRTLSYLTDIAKVLYERCIKRLPELWCDFDMKTAALAAECFQQCLQTANSVYKEKFADVFLKGFDLNTSNNSSNNKDVTSTVQDVIYEYMQEDLSSKKASKKKDEALSNDADGRKIPYALLQCLEVLYDNISYENRLAIDSYTWLLKFCKEFEVHTKEMGLVHKLLFVQRQKTHSGAFFNGIALKLGKVLGEVTDNDYSETENLPTQTTFDFKSLNLDSAESCLQHLYAALRKQIEDIEYFIVKANNSSYKYRIVAEVDKDVCLTSLRALQRSICSQMVHISNALLNLTNVCIPLGTCMEQLLKLVMQHYICLKNLAKHLLSCCNTKNGSVHSTRFSALLKVVGKRLPTNIYRLITYIEANIFDENQKKKPNPQAEKAKVLRETKLIPKIILSVENFNKHVILLEKKTSDSLTNYLHFGVVRDFRIKTSELKAAIERTISHTSQIEVDPSGEVEEEVEDQEDGDETIVGDFNAEETTHDDIDITDNNSRDTQNESEEVQNASKKATKTKPKPKSNSKSVESSAPASKTQKRKSQRNVVEEKEKQATKPAKASKKSKTSVVAVVDNDENDSTHDTSTPGDVSPFDKSSNESVSEARVLKNIEKMNKQARKRTLYSGDHNNEADMAPSAVQPDPKKRRGRPTRS